jgi:hypothetical protein
VLSFSLNFKGVTTDMDDNEIRKFRLHDWDEEIKKIEAEEESF